VARSSRLKEISMETVLLLLNGSFFSLKCRTKRQTGKETHILNTLPPQTERAEIKQHVSSDFYIRTYFFLLSLCNLCLGGDIPLPFGYAYV
jgi:hypothetical protein